LQQKTALQSEVQGAAGCIGWLGRAFRPALRGRAFGSMLRDRGGSQACFSVAAAACSGGLRQLLKLKLPGWR
jgi:hypothetical protein